MKTKIFKHGNNNIVIGVKGEKWIINEKIMINQLINMGWHR